MSTAMAQLSPGPPGERCHPVTGFQSCSEATSPTSPTGLPRRPSAQASLQNTGGQQQLGETGFFPAEKTP